MPDSLLTTTEFAAKIREKYGAYQDKSDDELVNAFLTKYPVYRSRIAPPTPKPSPLDSAFTEGMGVVPGPVKPEERPVVQPAMDMAMHQRSAEPDVIKATELPYIYQGPFKALMGLGKEVGEVAKGFLPGGPEAIAAAQASAKEVAKEPDQQPVSFMGMQGIPSKPFKPIVEGAKGFVESIPQWPEMALSMIASAPEAMGKLASSVVPTQFGGELRVATNPQTGAPYLTSPLIEHPVETLVGATAPVVAALSLGKATPKRIGGLAGKKAAAIRAKAGETGGLHPQTAVAPTEMPLKSPGFAEYLRREAEALNAPPPIAETTPVTPTVPRPQAWKEAGNTGIIKPALEAVEPSLLRPDQKPVASRGVPESVSHIYEVVSPRGPGMDVPPGWGATTTRYPMWGEHVGTTGFELPITAGDLARAERVPKLAASTDPFPGSPATPVDQPVTPKAGEPTITPPPPEPPSPPRTVSSTTDYQAVVDELGKKRTRTQVEERDYQQAVQELDRRRAAMRTPGVSIGSAFGGLTDLAKKHPTLTGATVGGALGANADEDNPLRGAVLGMATGAGLVKGAKALHAPEPQWKSDLASASADLLESDKGLQRISSNIAGAKPVTPADILARQRDRTAKAIEVRDPSVYGAAPPKPSPAETKFAEQAAQLDPVKAGGGPKLVDDSLAKWMKEEGRITVPTSLALGGGVAGAATGATIGDSPEERFINALVAGGAGSFLGLTGGRAIVSALTTPKTVKNARSYLSPEAQRRLDPTVPALDPGNFFRNAAKFVADKVLRPALQNEYQLIKGGFHDVAEWIGSYKSKRLDVGRDAFTSLKHVLEGLVESPEDYADFWGIIRFRADLENMTRLGTAEAIAPGKRSLTRAEIESSLRTLESHASPAVLEAAQRHRDLMKSMADTLVEAGHLSPQTVKAHAEYLPEYVMKYMMGEVEESPYKPMGAKWPMRGTRQGYLRMRKGGERITMRLYDKLMLKYLMEVKSNAIREELVKKIADKYDLAQNKQLSTIAFVPEGYTQWIYNSRKIGHTYVLPDPIVKRLRDYVEQPSWATKIANDATGKLKGVILKSVWGSFNIANFAGDIWRFWSFDSSWNPAKKAAFIWDASRAQSLKQFQRDPAKFFKQVDLTKLSPTERALLNVADMSDVYNLGTGAATGELGAHSSGDPLWRRVTDQPEVSPGKRFAASLADSARAFDYRMNMMREYLEGVPRTAKFMEELSRGNAPEQAAKVTRKIMIDYTDITPFEEKMLRGFLAPFWVFYRKNLESYIPGLATDAEGSRWGGAKLAGHAIGKALTLSTAVTLYNEALFPEAEHNLSEYERNQFHFFLPGPTGGLKYIHFPGPANMAARQLGLGGVVQRGVKAVRDAKAGYSHVGSDIASETGKQIWQQNAGLLTPFLSVPISVATGADLRTGKAMYPASPSASERATGLINTTLTAVPPVAAWARAERASEGSPTAAAVQGLKRLALGNFVRDYDVNDEFTRRKYEALGKAKGQQTADALQAKRTASAPIAESLLKMGSDAAESNLPLIWNALNNLPHEAKQVMQARYVDALRQAAEKDQSFTPILKRYQLLVQPMGRKTLPYIREEFKTLDNPNK